jgi:hypothetical protein
MQIPKLLAQAAPAASTLTLLYKAPAGAKTNIHTVVLCNRVVAATTFRLALAPGGAADAPAHYLYYDFALNGNLSHIATLDLTISEGDEVRVYTPSANVSCNLFGTESF